MVSLSVGVFLALWLCCTAEAPSHPHPPPASLPSRCPLPFQFLNPDEWNKKNPAQNVEWQAEPNPFSKEYRRAQQMAELQKTLNNNMELYGNASGRSPTSPDGSLPPAGGSLGFRMSIGSRGGAAALGTTQTQAIENGDAAAENETE